MNALNSLLRRITAAAAIFKKAGMKVSARGVLRLAVVPLMAFVMTPVAMAETATLKVGASKVDITPDEDKLPGQFIGILDRVHVRAVVLESGDSRAALVTVDVGGIPDQIWQRVSAKLAADLDIPVENLIMTATHTHSVPFGVGLSYEEKLFQAVSEAVSALQPARMSNGNGVSYINVNRNIIDPKTNRWWEGPNYTGPSDKTVAVINFESLSGEPIAVFYNFAMHPVITGNLDMISGDVPGAASKYIEDSLGGDVIAINSYGASGDQNPIFFQQTYDLREIRIADYAAKGEDISNAMPPGGMGMDRSNPRVAMLMEQQKQMNLTLGQMLGEEVLHVLRQGLNRPVSDITIDGAQKTVMCPGRKRLNEGRAGYPGVYEDADPIGLRLSLLRLGDTVIGGVNSEMFTLIAQRLKAESPIKHTILASLTNGSSGSGYIPNDEAYAQYTFEVVSSRLKEGCAETAIVNGLLDLIEETEE